VTGKLEAFAAVPAIRSYPRNKSGPLRLQRLFHEAGDGWWARQDSSLQPDRYERSALTIELQALRVRITLATNQAQPAPFFTGLSTAALFRSKAGVGLTLDEPASG
jgi:hypothetical protein